MSAPSSGKKSKRLMSCAGDSRASKSLPAAKRAGLLEIHHSGTRCVSPFASYDLGSSSWKMWGLWLLEDSEPFLATYPNSGSMRNGVAYRRVHWVRHSHGKGCSWLPTPTATMNQLAPSMRKHPGCVRMQSILGTGGSPGVEWMEKMMGFPVGWTALPPSATRSSRKSRKSLGG